MRRLINYRTRDIGFVNVNIIITSQDNPRDCDLDAFAGPIGRGS